ncbi:hypothetical protein EN858_14795 [Mesorhizobium sp. M4B.F.Ca.ET.215.01.1.1]|uniref:3'-5' exoribonuclease domain-containing protein n=1 Tax=unclassified Mesorhizobium TaxID=325217 RepID=UPI001093D289|nr:MULTISPECIES: 3'-5' exoribonuclease [unclassified Mesorhizobium]TGQ11188.1 hypothetical protein EN858_14795 [Mesorhizobium sp. M4B.F.Ca.ET.215.01.1.1]TGR04759.1 hypothetical protein EN846_13285 [Mesorhizobium sp. M4B.F.Ca.ET.203.01.1.1]
MTPTPAVAIPETTRDLEAVSNRVWFDTEFIEDGKTIELLSIGLVKADGSAYYAEPAETDRSRASEWVKQNVLPHLTGETKPRAEIAQEIIKFVGEKPEFWAYYADYDWVALCQLYGTMMDLPAGWPMLCMDVQQLRKSAGNPELPKQTSTEHNALADAIWTRDAFAYLASSSAAPSGEADPVAWCQPMKNGEHTPRKFIVRFEDADMGDAIFDDEAEAREYFKRVNWNWNCYLFGTLPLDPSIPTRPASPIEQGEVERLIERPILFMDEKGVVYTSDGGAVKALVDGLPEPTVGRKLLPLVPATAPAALQAELAKAKAALEKQEIEEDRAATAMAEVIQGLRDRAARAEALAAATAVSVPGMVELTEFAKEMCRVGFDGSDASGGEILEAAEQHGLVRCEAYDPAVHSGITNSEYLNPGDSIYVFAGPLAASPSALTDRGRG